MIREGCSFPALSNIWSSVEDLHLCNDSISTDVTQTCTVLANAFLPVADKNLHIIYCYFRMYQVLGWIQKPKYLC